jgi:hypothetical protein
MEHFSEDKKRIIENEFSKQLWTTSNGTKIQIGDMDKSHLVNVIAFIQRNTKKDLENELPNELSLKMKLASLKNTKEELQQMNSPGLMLIENEIQTTLQLMNSGFKITETDIQKKLSSNLIYQCLKKELEKRDTEEQNRPINTSETTFLEPKLQATILHITKNPERIPIVLSIEVNKTFKDEKAKPTVGDYVHSLENNLYRITYLNQQDLITEITLNARTENEKQIVLKNLSVGQSVIIY